jgi:hypothetical protein
VVAKIGIALLGALEVAHAHGVLHRDVKPANVLICTDGRCVLTDFGVARMPTDVQLTTPGMVLGSPHFISPERAMGSDFGPPSDLFSLGVTLYTAIEGRPPFDKGDPIETMHAVVEDPPTPAVRAGSLTTVLMGLLEKDPARRFDVQTARTMLRQQLAGPLASKAPPHMMTDPYSVVPSQRPPTAETQQIPPAQAKPSGQIGGRAMLAPGESLTGRLAKLKQGGAGGGRRRAAEPASAPTGSYPPPPGLDDNRTSVLPPSGGSESDETSVLPPRRQWDGARAARDPLHGTVVTSPAAQRRAVIDKTAAAVRGTTGKALTTVRGWPRNTQLIAGGGALAAVVAVILVFSLTGRGGDDTGAPPDQPSAGNQVVPASFATQDYKGDKAVTVKVPKSWERSSTGNWVDYVNPEDKSTKVRVLVEKGAIPPRKFAETTAPATLRRSKACAKPFQHLGTTDVEVSGLPGAQFEYTCGEGADMRHGIWRQTTNDGKMYSFYLTTTEARFAGSKQYFDEMAKTFTLKSS